MGSYESRVEPRQAWGELRNGPDPFKDPGAIVEIDDRQDYGEERLVRTAMVGVRYLHVVYTEETRSGDEVIRIISARKATAHERRTYHET